MTSQARFWAGFLALALFGAALIAVPASAADFRKLAVTFKVSDDKGAAVPFATIWAQNRPMDPSSQRRMYGSDTLPNFDVASMTKTVQRYRNSYMFVVGFRKPGFYLMGESPAMADEHGTSVWDTGLSKERFDPVDGKAAILTYAVMKQGFEPAIGEFTVLKGAKAVTVAVSLRRSAIDAPQPAYMAELDRLRATLSTRFKLNKDLDSHDDEMMAEVTKTLEAVSKAAREAEDWRGAATVTMWQALSPREGLGDSDFAAAFVKALEQRYKPAPTGRFTWRGSGFTNQDIGAEALALAVEFEAKSSTPIPFIRMMAAARALNARSLEVNDEVGTGQWGYRSWLKDAKFQQLMADEVRLAKEWMDEAWPDFILDAADRLREAGRQIESARLVKEIRGRTSGEYYFQEWWSLQMWSRSDCAYHVAFSEKLPEGCGAE